MREECTEKEEQKRLKKRKRERERGAIKRKEGDRECERE